MAGRNASLYYLRSVCTESLFLTVACAGLGFTLFRIFLSALISVSPSPCRPRPALPNAAMRARGPLGTRGPWTWELWSPPRCRGPLGSPVAQAKSNSVSVSEPSRSWTDAGLRPSTLFSATSWTGAVGLNRPAPTHHPPSGALGGLSRGAGVSGDPCLRTAGVTCVLTYWLTGTARRTSLTPSWL